MTMTVTPHGEKYTNRNGKPRDNVKERYNFVIH